MLVGCSRVSVDVCRVLERKQGVGKVLEAGTGVFHGC